LLPLFKLIVWVYFVFVPSKSVIRSRALFIADTLGKFQLASLYILTLVSIGMTFNRRFAFPGNPAVRSFDADEVHLDNVLLYPRFAMDVRTSMNPGLGSWMFEITFISSLLFGQMLVSANLVANEWHERAKKQATAMTTQLEQVEDQVGGDEVLYRAEKVRQEGDMEYRPYDWSEDEATDDFLYMVQPMFPASTTVTPLLSSAGLGVATDRNRRGSVETSVSFISRRSSATSIHPHVLALCDRTLYPQKGIRLKFTTKGKLMILSCLLLNGVLLLICQFITIFEIQVSELFGLMKGEMNSDHSLMTVFQTLAGANGQTKLVDVATLFVATTCIAPTLRLFGMIFLWMLPLTLRGKRNLLHGLEILSAWSSLDVLLISLVLMFFGMETTTRQLIATSVPGMSKVMHFLLPAPWSDLSASIHPTTVGFTLLTITVVLDKFVAHIVFEQAVASIAERIADQTLNEAVVAITNNIGQVDENGLTMEDMDDLESLRRTVRLPSEEEIIDAAEDLLESEAVTYFGPVERYVSALMPNKMYAGFPRRFWTRLAKSLGIVDDAAVITAFNEAGEVIQSPW